MLVSTSASELQRRLHQQNDRRVCRVHRSMPLASCNAYFESLRFSSRSPDCPRAGIIGEFCTLVSKKRRLKELNQRQAKEVLDLFATHVAEGFYRRVVLTAEHYLKASRRAN
jgi:hypothetical protein